MAGYTFANPPHRLLRSTRNDKITFRKRPIDPTSKSLLIFRNSVKPGSKKYFAFGVGQITGITPPVSPDEGRLAIVTNVRWDAVDAEVTTTNVADADGEVVWS